MQVQPEKGGIRCGRLTELCQWFFTNPETPHAPQIRGLKIHPSILGGEASQIPCFTVVFGAHSRNSRGEIFTPLIWVVWLFRERTFLGARSSDRIVLWVRLNLLEGSIRTFLGRSPMSGCPFTTLLISSHKSQYPSEVFILTNSNSLAQLFF